MAINTALTGKKTFKDTAGSDSYIIGVDATKITIAGKMTTGDVINVEGLATEYSVKASGRTITLKSDTQTITFQLSNLNGAAQVRFLDGSLDAKFDGKVAYLGAQKLAKKAVAVNDSALGANSSSGTFEGGSGGATGNTFTLTKDIEAVTGTSGDDVVVATHNGTDNTLNIGDEIDGGAGKDTLRLTTLDDDISLAGVDIKNVENIAVRALDNTFDTLDLAGNKFASLQLTVGAETDSGNRADVTGISSATAVTVDFASQAATGAQYAETTFTFDTNTDEKVNISHVVNFAMTGEDGDEQYAYFNHDLTKATEVNATYVLTGGVADGVTNDYAEMYSDIDVGGKNAVVNIDYTSKNWKYTNETSTWEAWQGVNVDHDGTATVNAKITLKDEANVAVEIDADDGNDMTEQADNTATVILDNVSMSKSSDDSGVWLYGGFANVNFDVVKNSTIAYVEASDAAFTYESQDININAAADLSVDYFETAGAGKVVMKISGAGNVKIGELEAGGTATGDTVTIDASTLNGNLNVDINDRVNSVIAGKGDDRVVIRDVSAFASTTTDPLVVTGGAGTDTIGFEEADWSTISGGTAANRGKISGFEVLEIVGALDTATYDLSKLSGVTSFVGADGVATTDTAIISNVGNNGSVTLKGDLVTNNGDIDVRMAAGAAVLNVVLNNDYTDDNDTSAEEQVNAEIDITADAKTLNITATGTQEGDLSDLVSGYKADHVTYVVDLVNDDIETVNISGNQHAEFTSKSTQTALTQINASTNTGGVVVDVSAASTTAGVAAAITITGSKGDDDLTGSDNNDTISGGDGKDTIEGGAGADRLAGGAGNDKFVFGSGDSTAAKIDVITDFVANTYGQGTSGKADENGATTDSTKINGDVIDLSAATPTKIELITVSNATDAQLAITAASDDTTLTSVNIAFDTSSSKLYIDSDDDGAIDAVIQLTGVKSITEAAFVV